MPSRTRFARRSWTHSVRRSLLDLLAEPGTRAPLALTIDAATGEGDVVEGTLGGREGSYPVHGGIPRFVRTEDEGQLQTAESFGYKWGRVDSYESDAVRASATSWLLDRYGFPTIEAMRDHFAALGTVLDAGCGSGFSSSLWLDAGWTGSWIGADISSAVDVAQRRLAGIPGVELVQADILDLPFPDGAFGAVFSEGVLHHTPSTERALHAVARLLRPGGELYAYVYRRKAPLREFADDHVREAIAGMPPEEAWAAMRPLTRLAQALSELQVEVEVPEDVEVLGIPAGRYDVQRLLYWHVAKLFWNPALSFEENVHVNFDWYHPRYAHRQTEEQLRQWCADAGLDVLRLHVDDAGYTVRARRALDVGAST